MPHFNTFLLASLAALVIAHARTALLLALQASRHGATMEDHLGNCLSQCLIREIPAMGMIDTMTRDGRRDTAAT